jgi:acetolactate synthase-1/2/3 large subunit
MNVADVVVEFAVRLGATNCFSLNGGMAMYLNKSLMQNPKIEVTFTHHEQAAICAAEGYSKALNFSKPGLACVTAGPGVSNSITGLLSAFADSVPLLVLAGQVKTGDIDTFGVRTHGVQEIKSQELISPAVKAFYRISEEFLWDQLASIEKEFRIGRKGPIFIEIPLDVQALVINSPLEKLNEIFATKVISKEVFPKASLSLISKMIKSSSRISVYLGNGIRISGIDQAIFLKTLDRFHIPRFYSWLSQDLENYYNTNNLNCPGSLAPTYSNQYLQESDLVFFLGARLDLGTTGFQRERFGANAQRVIIDVDAAELKKFNNNPKDLLLEYNLENGLDFLKELFEVNCRVQSEWSDLYRNSKKDYLELEGRLLKSNHYTTRDLTLELSKVLKSGTLVMSSSGFAAEGVARFFRANGELRFFHGGGLGSMGQGLSHGVGACKARTNTDEPVWIIESDGGLWMNVHEIATLKAINGKNVVLFILNNNGYASIRNSQIRHFENHFGTSADDGLLFPDWKLIAESLNIDFISLNDPWDFNFESLIGVGRLKIVEIKLQSTEKRGPSLKTVMTDFGPKTQNLEDINWE